MSRQYRNIRIAVGTLVALGTFACSNGGEPESTFGPPSIGDVIDDGTVVDVVEGAGCNAVTIEYAPEWQCSGDQINEVSSGYGSPGAGGTGAGGAPSTGEEKVDLLPSTCEGLADLRRPIIKDMQRNTLDQNRYYLLADKCVKHVETRYLDDYGEPCSPPNQNIDGGMAGTGGSGGSAMPGSSGAGGGGADEYSTTNNQVDGVHEADFVKNDGEHAYVLSADGLHIIDAWPAADTHEVAHLTLRGEPRRMFLAGDRLMVYSRTNAAGGGVPSNQGCTYGYDCRFESEGGQTFLQVFDVTDPANPVPLKSYETSGGYVSSRRIGSAVYTVVHDYGISAAPDADLDFDADEPEALEEEYVAKRAAADAAIDTLPPQYFLPWVREVDEQGQVVADLTSCDRALTAAAAKGESFVSVFSTDITGESSPRRTLVAAKAGYVYASADALYLAADGTDGGDDYYAYHASPEDDRSTIHKFAIEGLDTSYVGSTSIAGHLLNQFSMDEFEGVLRVATSSGWVPNPGVSSNITTLREVEGDFSVIGELSGLAPSEDIRSVRFDGDRGFMVTFKKTDPLFVIDLSSPAVPSVLGELKIPGFSTYMHPLDANHLLAIGFDADEQGDFAYFDGIQIQIFDVTELSNPLLMHKHVVGTRGSGSEALLNHLAFNYFAPRATLAIPMTICEGGDDGVYGDTLTFSGLMTFDISLEDGIAEHGRMPFVDPASAYGSCGQWWTDATSNVKRSIFMDDYVYGISDTQFRVAALEDMSEVLQSIPLD